MILIDAEELKHRVNNSKYYGTERQRDFCDMITESPTIDAVEVVRCKDCYHAEDDITHMFCVYFHHKVYEDDYCSNAVKRREESEVEE